MLNVILNGLWNYLAGANTIWYGLDDSFLRWLSSIINSKNVRVNSRAFYNDSSNQTSEVIVVNSRYKIVPLSYEWQSCWILQPGTFKVVMKNSLTITVTDTRTQNMNS